MRGVMSCRSSCAPRRAGASPSEGPGRSSAAGSRVARSRSRSRSQKPRRSRGGFYGPAQAGDFAEWAGLSKSHAQRLWDEVADELIEVEVEKDTGSLMADDRRALESPPAAQGIRLIPPPGTHSSRRPTGRCLCPSAIYANGYFGRWRAPERYWTTAASGDCGGSRPMEPRPSSRSRRPAASSAETSRRRPNEWRSCAESPKRRSSSPDPRPDSSTE
jgi:Winged helix DNA-binding domain